MSSDLRIGIIGDFNPESPTHAAIDSSIRHAARHWGRVFVSRWLPTPELESMPEDEMRNYDALWCAPGSPYRSLDGALRAVRFARERRVPLLGTCAGFQHIVLEFARNALGFRDAQHAEYDPSASRLFINRLACSLVGKTMTVRFKGDSLARRLYGRDEAHEQYYCNFGLNAEYRDLIDRGGLRITGTDHEGEARIVELGGHPFLMGTLFVPEMRSAPGTPHPLIVGLLESAMVFSRSRGSHAGCA